MCIRDRLKVSGVPPDAFSEDGQLWGNPLYDWEKMEQTDFAWWRSRMKASAKLYDAVRIDHFIGVVQYYACLLYTSPEILTENPDAGTGVCRRCEVGICLLYTSRCV